MAECYPRNELCLIDLRPPCNFSDFSMHSYDLQRSQKYRFFSNLPLPTKKASGRKEWGLLSEHVSLKNIKEKVCWNLWPREKVSLFKRGNFLPTIMGFKYLQNKNYHKRWFMIISQGKLRKAFF